MGGPAIAKRLRCKLVLTAVITRPIEESPRWIAALNAMGCHTKALPLIAIHPIPDSKPIEQAWNLLTQFKSVMFVSRAAVHHFFASSANLSHKPWPNQTFAWATGPGTRQALLDEGVPQHLIFMPDGLTQQFDSEHLWQVVGSQVTAGDCVLIVRGADAATGSSGGRDWLAQRLHENRVVYQWLAAYQRALPNWNDEQIQQARQANNNQTVWIFSSSQAVANLAQLLPNQDWSQTKAIATHARIAKAAQDIGFGVVLTSRPTIQDLIVLLESMK
jgi:uroporphyrinogen-III synthase